MAFERDVVVVGGCGRVGLPLGLAFAQRGLKVALYDVNQAAVSTVSTGTMPFWEDGAQEVLDRVLGNGLVASADPSIVSSAEDVIVVIGTPVDEHLNPDPNAVTAAIGALQEEVLARSDLLIVAPHRAYQELVDISGQPGRGVRL